MSEHREYLAPTDIVCLVFVAVLAVLYAITREPDFKTALLGLIVFQSGRLSAKFKMGGSAGD